VSRDISVDEFHSEQDVASGTARVSDILARGVRVNWDEAVALLQEVLETVTAGDAPIPVFNDIVIDAAGTVSIQRGRGGERGPVAAGRALHALLATADVPVALRLFVTQANSPDTHSSLAAFANGLAYFGRPGRAELIAAIYKRYRSSAASIASTPSQSVVPPIPSSARANESQEPRRTPARWLMPAAVGLLVASLFAVIWLGVFGGDGGRRAESAVTQAKAAGVTLLTKNSVASQTKATQQGPSAPKAEQEPGVTATRTRPAAAPADGRARRRVVDDSSARSMLSVLNLSPISPAQAPGTPQSAPVVPTPREDVDARARVSEPKTIYSSADWDVEPPVMRYPSLPPPVFVARNADPVVVNRMELVIAADGSVERVRLVNGPTRMPDMMLLSGAKLWKFTPATKDGHAVRYRTTVTWSGFP
jgi:hypothetical protein